MIIDKHDLNVDGLGLARFRLMEGEHAILQNLSKAAQIHMCKENGQTYMYHSLVSDLAMFDAG